MKMTLMELPPEIMDDICDQADTSTLQALALTCKALLKPCRRNLHYMVAVQSDRIKNLSVVYNSADIARWIRTIYLHGDKKFPWMSSHLLSLLAVLTLYRVEELVFFSTIWTSVPLHALCFLRQYKHLVSLAMIDVTGCSSSELQYFVLAFPQLSDLTLESIQCTNDVNTPLIHNPGSTMSQNHLLQLKSLSLTNCDPTLVALLLPHLGAFEKLWLEWNDHEKIEIVYDLLGIGGGTLRDLALNLHVPHDMLAINMEPLERKLILKNNPNISALSFVNLDFINADLSWPFYLLSTMSPMALETFGFGCSVHRQVDDLFAFDWDRLDQLLSQPQCRLSEISIQVLLARSVLAAGEDLELNVDRVQQALTKKFKKLGARVRVKVDSLHWYK